MSMPEEWPWEEAKLVFEKPDVTPADEIEVGQFSHVCEYLTENMSYTSWSGQTQTLTV